MIYLYEFFKGIAWAFLLFGAFYFFHLFGYNFIFLCLGAIPGFALMMIAFLLIENHDLRQKLDKKRDNTTNS